MSSDCPARALISALLAVAAIWAGACGGVHPGAENLLLVTLDTTRADHIGAYGCVSAETPTVDRLAREGVRFERCFTVSPITLPSHASLLTGLYPFHHGVRMNGTHNLPANVPTLAGALAARGFTTGAVVSAMVLDSRHGLDRGFQIYDDDLSQASQKEVLQYRETKAEDTTRRALRWLESVGDERWFLWVHFFDPHTDYAPPEPYAGRHANSPYDGEIAYADAQLGIIIQALETRGDLDETLVVVTADHGESLSEHGEKTHGIFVYDATTRVPLILRHPTLAAGTVVEPVVSLVDVAPTVLEFLDVPMDGASDGRSLLALARAESVPEWPAYSESMVPLYSYGWSDLRTLRDGRGRFVRAPQSELYDLRTDPGERNNLLPSEETLAHPYEERLRSLLPEVEANARAQRVSEMDPEVRNALADLGYTQSDIEDESEDATRARLDPKDGLEALELGQRGRDFLREGRLVEAEAVLSRLLERHPNMVETRGLLAQALSRQDRPAEALEVMQELLVQPELSCGHLVRIAELEYELGRKTWRARLDLAKQLDPRATRPWLREGTWAQEAGDPNAAERAFRSALERDARCAEAWKGLGGLAVKARDFEAARQALEQAVECDPQLVDCWLALGAVLAEGGESARALAAFARAAQQAPTDVRPHASSGNLHLREGRLDEARQSFRAALAIDGELWAVQYNLGLCELQAGEPARAAAALQRACEIDAGHADSWRSWMAALRQTGEHAGALAAAERLLELEPESIQGWLGAGLAEYGLGREARAIERVRRALALDEARVLRRSKRDPDVAVLVAAARN